MNLTSQFLLGVLFLLSIVANITFVIRSRKQKVKTTLALDAQQLLHELTRGGRAVLRVEVIDASSLFFWSPKG